MEQNQSKLIRKEITQRLTSGEPVDSIKEDLKSRQINIVDFLNKEIELSTDVINTSQFKRKRKFWFSSLIGGFFIFSSIVLLSNNNLHFIVLIAPITIFLFTFGLAIFLIGYFKFFKK